MNETVSLEVAIEVVLRNGPTFETIAGLCKMAVEAEREKVAAWMIRSGYATGHGDTIEDLLNELDWQIREQEREACTKVAEFVCSNGSCRFTLTQTNVGLGARKL